MNRRQRNIDSKFWLNILFCGLVVAGMGVFLIGMPKYADDLWYLRRMRPWFEAQGIWYPTDGGNPLVAGIPWKEIWETIQEHLDYDNSRLCNIVVILFLLLPKWIGSGVALLAWVLAMYFSLQLVGVNWKSSRLVVPALAMWSLLMPWSQQMGAMDYQFNYLVSSGLMLWLLCELKTDNFNKWPKTVLFVVSFIIGIWHEGFTLPVVVGLLAIGLRYKRIFHSREIRMVLAGFCAALLLLLFAPCTWVRLIRESSDASLYVGSVLKAFVTHPGFLLYLGGLLYVIVRERSVKPALTYDSLFIIASSLTVICLQIFIAQARRTGWWADLVGIIGVLILLRRYRSLFPVKSWLQESILVLSGVLILVYWALVDFYTLRIAAQSREWTREYVFDNKSSIFADFITLSELPIFSQYTPDAGLFHSISWLGRYYNYYGKELPISIIPKCLENVTLITGRSLSRDGQIREVEGKIFTEGDYESCSSIIAEVRYVNGLERTRDFRVFSFSSQRDGRQYHYLYSEPDLIGDVSGKIVDIKVKQVIP